MAALQTSGKCSHTARMLKTTTFPTCPAIARGRRRIGLQLVELHNFHKNRCEIPLQAEPLNLIWNFETTSIVIGLTELTPSF